MNIINIPQIVESGQRGVFDEGEQGEELCHKQIIDHINHTLHQVLPLLLGCSC